MADPNTLIERQTLLANFLVAGWPTLSIPGLPPVSAAGAVGNATQENQCYPVTMGVLDHGSDGLFQWRLDRLTKMQQFGDEHFGTWQKIEAQAAFFSFECMTDFSALWADLMSGKKTIATNTANIMAAYEKPAQASAMLDARISYATKFMAAWTPVSSPVSPPPVVAPVPPSPPPIVVPIPVPNLVVVQALANAILQSQKVSDIKLLAAAIVKELS